jgi:hypothetical protein
MEKILEDIIQILDKNQQILSLSDVESYSNAIDDEHNVTEPGGEKSQLLALHYSMIQIFSEKYNEQYLKNN